KLSADKITKHFGYIITLLPGKDAPCSKQNIDFFYYPVIKSVSEKIRERESLADLLNENDVMVNPRQLPSAFRKTLAIH
ncbi:MAG TPA: hypothetical protein VJ280_07680, partial [Dehalococcoidales bacterium]|nr:hypothetical protein [Dehalococcoidales bacterium]